MFLSRDEAAQLVRMGPSAWHVDEQSLGERLAALPDPLTVTASVTLLAVPARLAVEDVDLVAPWWWRRRADERARASPHDVERT